MRLRAIASAVVVAVIAACRSGAPTTDGGRLFATGFESSPELMTCRLVSARGDASMAALASGEVIVVSMGLRMLRLDPGGALLADQSLPWRGRWPAVAVAGDALLVSYVAPHRPHRLCVLRSEDEGRHFARPVVVYASQRRIIDTELLALADGALLLFAVEVTGELGSHEARHTILCFASTDGGRSWEARTAPVGGREGVHLEDPRAVELAGGDLLLAWEHELEEGGSSRIAQLRSSDGGRSWGEPVAIWDDVEAADYEPGGYVLLGDGRLWFVSSTDELQPGGSYATAVLRRKESTDGGRSWHHPTTIVDRPDQLSFGAVRLASGELGLLSLRHRGRPGSEYAFYVVDPERPGAVRCAGPRP